MGCHKLKPLKNPSGITTTHSDSLLSPTRSKSRMSILVQTISSSLTDDYKIIKLIGEGSFGQVHEVLEKSTNLKRAAKSIQTKYLKPHQIEKVFEEIRILKSLDHPGIIRIFQVYREPNLIHIITELCTGGELFEEIAKNRTLSENQIGKYMFDIVSTVKYLHETGIMHRDLKPDNILFDDFSSMRLKIVDFGSSTNFDRVIKSTALVGTPFYIAPEVIKGSYSSQCDVWSIGVIMYIMISGNPPFKANSNNEIYHKILNESPNFSGTVWKSFSKCGKNLVQRALEKDPNKRITISEFFFNPWILTRSANLVPDRSLSLKSLNNLSKFKQINKFQACINIYLCQSFTTLNEFSHVRKLFETFDKNGDGKLSLEEVKEGLKEYSKDFQLNVEEIMSNCDMDMNGYIDYSEFLTAVTYKNLEISKLKLGKAFSVIDLDGNGKISRSELRQALIGMTTEKNIEDLITEIDQNGDGEIDIDEFTKALSLLV